MREYMRTRRARDKGLREQENKHRQTTRTKREKTLDVRTFVGIDGEGRNLASGYHAYFLLRAGDTTCTVRPGESRLRTRDILSYLSDLPTENIYVGYFFEYDDCKILEDLPFSTLHRLVHREERKKKNGKGYWPVRWREFELDYMPRKYLKVRRRGQSWVEINDVGPFFQSRFHTAIKEWDVGTEEERAQIKAGKDLRSEFSEIGDEYVTEYNALECKLLAQLMEKFRAACEEIGYVPKRWQGAGQLAEAMFEKHGIPQTVDLDVWTLYPELAEFARNSFYGGRFETSMVGFTDAPCVQFDINSAYPDALRHVPCLVHGKWERVTGKRRVGDDELSICFGRFKPKAKDRAMFYGFPVRRDDGSIHFPANGRGWYWSFESRAAKHQIFDCYDSWIYSATCQCRPFDFMGELYTSRKAWGKTGKGIALKVAMNAVYGKLAQSIGDPKYSNPILASFITAWCRTKIADAIHSLPCCESPTAPCGHDVFMIATDAIYTRDYDTFTIDEGNGLGQWSKERHEDGLFIIQPGLYFDPGGDTEDSTFKTRGVPNRLIREHKQEFVEAFKEMKRTREVPKGDVYLPATLFTGIRQAVHRRNMKIMGQFKTYIDPETGKEGRKTSFEWMTKRRALPYVDYLEGTGLGPNRIVTIPYLGTEDEDPKQKPVQTVPYDKDIGGLRRRDELRLDFADQPDWIEV